MRNVAVAEGDKVDAEIRFGVSVNTYGVNELVECCQGSAADVRVTSVAGRPMDTQAFGATGRCAGDGGS